MFVGNIPDSVLVAVVAETFGDFLTRERAVDYATSQVVFDLSCFVLLVLVLAGAFATGVRRERFFIAVLKGWLYFFLCNAGICFGVPILVGYLEPGFRREIWYWVPEGPAVAAALFLGWWPAVIFIAAGRGVRWVIEAFKQYRRRREHAP